MVSYMYQRSHAAATSDYFIRSLVPEMLFQILYVSYQLQSRVKVKQSKAKVYLN